MTPAQPSATRQPSPNPAEPAASWSLTDPICTRCLVAVHATSGTHAALEDLGDEVCQVALQVTGAREVALVVVPPSGDLQVSGYAGPDLGGFTGSVDELRDAAAQALESADVATIAAARRVARSSTFAGVYAHGLIGVCQPVPLEGGPPTVLVVRWERAIWRVNREVLAPIAILAEATGTALASARALRDLQRLALTDPLSGLPNRRAWDQELPRALASASRTAQPICVAIVDIDGFKALNDAEGHAASDQVLREMAAAGASSLRQVDYLARIGGDEFGVILPGCDARDAATSIRRMAAAFRGGHGFSAGIAPWDGEEDPETVLRRADRTLYRAKATHSGRVSLSRGRRGERRVAPVKPPAYGARRVAAGGTRVPTRADKRSRRV